MNPILNNPIKDLISKFVGTAKMVQNPQMAIKTMIQNNPQYKQYEGIMDQVNKYISENGGDPETACRKFAAQNGMDINALMGMFK